MKKLFFLFSFIFCIISCNTNYNERNNNIQNSIDNRIPTHGLRANDFHYKNHDYIIFQEGFGKSSVGTIIHSPDCKCHKIE